MRVSYNWLQTYFDDPLPKPDELAELLTFNAFETEEPERVRNDWTLEVDVLANRSSDSLCHRGIAREIATILGRPLKRDALREPVFEFPKSGELSVEVQDSKLCPRYIGAYMRGVKVAPSPDWLRERLESLGQRSINNIVDATNFVMFEIGQPLHAFDASKLRKDGAYTISVRPGRAGEKITTLTGEEYETGPQTLLIVDGHADVPIGIAGVKGGKVAEVDAQTTDIIIEAANFNYVSVRKTSQRLKLSTDASTRFQNEPSVELPLFAIREVVALIEDIAGGKLEGVVDANAAQKSEPKISVTLTEINSVLGTELSLSDAITALDRLAFPYATEKNVITVFPPFERTDLTIPQDIIEEIGRVHGYGKIEAKPLPVFEKPLELNPRFYYADKIRRLLAAQGFSEVFTYTLRASGEVELANALAADKNFMRATLVDGLREAVEKNLYYAPLLGLEKVCIFELGPVWKGEKEVLMLGLAASFSRKFKGETPDDTLRSALKVLSEALGAEIAAKPENGIVEIDLEKLLDKLPAPTSYDAPNQAREGIRYSTLSPYPYVLRDIAVWVPGGTPVMSLRDIIEQESGELLVRCVLFDEFTKDSRTSFAFHLVFQSKEKTLTDAEIGAIMERITARVHERGWEAR
jgi:phenylalanyl-tRNA synthetase beta chain